MDPYARPPQTDPALVGGVPLWLTGEDQLRLTAFNMAANVVVTVRGRFLPAGGGRVTPFEKTLTPALTRTASSITFALGEGWLLDVSASVTTGTPLIGQTFAVLSIVRGLSTFVDVCTLAADYVTTQQRVAYPRGEIRRSLDGQGSLYALQGADPAVNVECSDAVPTGARWELLAWTNTLVTDANAPIREVELTFDDGATVFARVLAGTTQAASLTRIYSFTRLGVRAAPTSSTMIPGSLADFQLFSSCRIQTVTSNRQVGDNWGAPQMLVREWLEAAA
jgi:hypothetical protein